MSNKYRTTILVLSGKEMSVDLNDSTNFWRHDGSFSNPVIGLSTSGNLTTTGANLYNYLTNFSGIFNNSGTNWQNQLNAIVAGTGQFNFGSTISNPLTGLGTLNYIPKFVSNSGLINSTIYDNGNIGLNNISPISNLDVSGHILARNISGVNLNLTGVLQITPILSSGVTLNIGNNSFYVHTGYNSDLWLLPTLASSVGKFYFVKNRGNSFQISGQFNEKIFSDQIVDKMTFPSGDAYIFVNSTNVWEVM